jgi:LPS export ABC transporter protein LptC
MRRAIATWAAVLVGVAACSKIQGPQVTAADTKADSAEQVMYGVRAPITDKGVRRGELIADTMYVYNDQTRFDFINGRAEFNTTTGAPNGTMRADRGRYDTRGQILEGWGNVVVTSVDGRTLKSPHVVYEQSRNEIRSDTTYTLTAGEGRVLSGIGLTADSKFTRYACARSCKASGNVTIPK